MLDRDLPTDFSFEDLQSQIDAIDGDAWRVERLLHRSPYEETQLVYRKGTDEGPFVRKLFLDESSHGNAYEALFKAQSEGTRLAHVPLAIDCAHTEAGLAVVMEYLEGETLRAHVGRVGASEELALEVAPLLCDALMELHTALEHPIIHRDIKPDNIMMDRGRLMLIDLGIAREWREGAKRDTRTFGTPGYAPPEQYGFGQTGVTGDIFAAGMTLAFCCTGEDPTPELRESGFDDPRIPPALKPVIAKATKLDPADRFQSAAEMRGAVDAVLDLRAGKISPKASKPTMAQAPVDRPRSPGQPAFARALDPLARIMPQESVGKRTLKYIWNALVVAYYLFIMFVLFRAIIAGISNPSPEAMEQMTSPGMWLLVISDVLIVIAMITVIAYLLLFKMGLRCYKPFSRFTWRQELPVGIGFVVCSYVIITLAQPLAQWMAHL